MSRRDDLDGTDFQELYDLEFDEDTDRMPDLDIFDDPERSADSDIERSDAAVYSEIRNLEFLDQERGVYAKLPEPPQRMGGIDPLEMVDPRAEITRRGKSKNLPKRRAKKASARDAKLFARARRKALRGPDFYYVERKIRQLRRFQDENGEFNADGRRYLKKVKAARAIKGAFPHDGPEFIMALGRLLHKYKTHLLQQDLYQRFLNDVGLDQTTANNFLRLWNTLGKDLKHFGGLSREKLLAIARHIAHAVSSTSREETLKRILAQLKRIKEEWTIDELEAHFPGKKGTRKGTRQNKIEEKKQNNPEDLARVRIVENFDRKTLILSWKNPSRDFQKRLADHIRSILDKFPPP